MAVHLPISDEAQEEARTLIAADKNILKPASGEPTIAHSQDMVLGIYYLTDAFAKNKQHIGHFNTVQQVLDLHSAGGTTIKDTVNLKVGDVYIETTIGKLIFNSVLPEHFAYVNETVGKKQLKKLLSSIFDTHGQEETVRVADSIKDL